MANRRTGEGHCHPLPFSDPNKGHPGWPGVVDAVLSYNVGRTFSRNSLGVPGPRLAGLPENLRIHDMRHTCAALLIAQGAHPKAIQVHLGHSSIQVTMDRYGHLFPNEWDRLAEGLDQTDRAALEGYQFGYQSDDENVVSLEKARVTRTKRSGAGRTRTSEDYESAHGTPDDLDE